MAHEAELEDEFVAAVADANVPTLLMFLVQATGDLRWLDERFQPARGIGLTDNDDGGLAADVLIEIRAAAAEAVRAFCAGKPLKIPRPSPALVVKMLRVCMGEEVGAEYGTMFAEELHRFTGRKLGSSPSTASPPPGFHVTIVGAGVSGLIAAAYLRDAGIDYTVVEKNPVVGGTWWQNRYPGAGVDTPSHLYSLSFAKFDWEFHFELRAELQAYLESVARDLDLAAHTRFATEVLEACFDESIGRWQVRTRHADGSEDTLTTDAVISSVGVLNRPKVPHIPGMESFRGPMFHTAEWPDDLDVTGQRVAIIGTGASAMQVGPSIADRVAELVVFQRSPQWVVPFDQFRQRVAPGLRRLLRDVPAYHGWYWLRLFWQFGDRVLSSLRIDPDWPHPERSVNQRNDRHRVFFSDYIRREIGDRTDLLEHVLPTYPPFGKRILMDNGWYRMLRKPGVTLVPHAVEQISERIVSAGGQDHEVDVVVLATGFEASRYVSSMAVSGRNGATLREVWDDDDARAYLGITVPGFPNFFMLGGPNSFPGSGSFMFFMEMQMNYISRLLARMFADNVQTVEPTTGAFDAYNETVDELHRQTIWSHPGMETFFRNDRGRVIFLSPFRNIEFWKMTQHVDFNDYVRQYRAEHPSAAVATVR